MAGRQIIVLTLLTLTALAGCQFAPKTAPLAGPTAIVVPPGASSAEELGAKEIRRYVYLRTGRLLPIVETNESPESVNLIIVAHNNRLVLEPLKKADPDIAQAVNNLADEQYILRTVRFDDRRCVLVVGVNQVATLYAAYRFAEHMGVRFYLHGDTVPDRQIPFALPEIHEKGNPLFAVRGIQPFHDFPEGPDWWNLDDYKAILAQLPKLRMNFLGLHTYPQGHAGPEPTVWIGLPEDVEPDGTVEFSSPSSYQNTLRGNWGYAATKTSDYCFGADQLFESDACGPEVMEGAMPWPESLEERNQVFNRTGRMLGDAFEFAHSLGIKTCVGTETPLIIPDTVKERIKSKGTDPQDPAVVKEVYRGMFERISKAYPLDYYWFWTPENWTWSDVKPEQVEATLNDFEAAISAAEEINAPFTLATCGWVLGPPNDRALFDKTLPKEMPVSCINRNVGFEPVEPGFANVQGRPKWAIPWLEDDPAMIIPQLWVGRMRRDAADALSYGCDGLLGIHWRTRILGPNVSALAHAAWHQSTWNPQLNSGAQTIEPKRAEGRIGGKTARFPDNEIAATEQPALYQTVLYDVRAYRIAVPDSRYDVTLKFCEPHYTQAHERVFGVELEGKRVIDSLDIFQEAGQNKALDYTFEDIEVTDNMVDIDFVKIIEFPSIAAIVVKGPAAARKINCAGPAWKDYSSDLPALGADARPRDLPADDFYADWARSQFGPEASQQIAKLFTKMDGGPLSMVGMPQVANLPRPATWVKGPGGIKPDPRPWEQVKPEYAFVDELAALRPLIMGRGNLERFDYWLNNFKYLRALGRVNCTWAVFNDVMEKVEAEKSAAKQQALALELALPVRKQLVADVTETQRYLLATINTTGSLGNVVNFQQHIFPTLLYEPGEKLAGFLGRPLPADAVAADHYVGPAKIIVPTVRTSLHKGESLSLKIIIPGLKSTREASLNWRPLGKGSFKSIPVERVARAVYSARIPADAIQNTDFEYYISAISTDNKPLVFPASAPKINQTVVIMQ